MSFRVVKHSETVRYTVQRIRVTSEFKLAAAALLRPQSAVEAIPLPNLPSARADSTIVSDAVLPGVTASLMQQCACIGLVCVLALGVAFNRAGKRRLASDGSSYGLHPTAQARFIASWSESCRLGWLRARWSLQRPSATLSVSMAAWGTAFSPYSMT